MGTPHRFGSAVSALALTAILAGCAAPQEKVAVSAGSVQKVGLATRALAALNARDFANAISLAEAAVENSPQEAMLRTLLGNAYFSAGRFASAEGAFKDSLTINSNQPQVILKLALVQTALGKPGEAVEFLEAARSVLNPSDLGLALALAGHPTEAVTLLDAAARQPGADATVRQNLALAYALSGDWTEARVIAAQDVPANQLDLRMQQWMRLATPKKVSDQVAALVGVTPVAIDAGQPMRLALNKGDTRMAAASPAPVSAVPAAPHVVQQAALTAPVPVTPALDSAPTTVEPAFVAAVAVPPAPPPPGAAKKVAVERTFIAEAASAIETGKSMLTEAAHRAEVTVASFMPKKTKVAAKPVKVQRIAASHRRVRSGDAVMQLGSYRSPEQVAEGWSRLTQQYPALRAYLPLKARFDSPKGTFWRLSVQGFSNRGEAVSRCELLRSRGGKCFVRAAAGDAPVQFASN